MSRTLPDVFRCLIIGIAVALLAGCSALRLTYNNGPALAWWWVDGYADFSDQQAPQVKAAIDRFFEWHRPTQLPEYIAFLQQAQSQVGGPLSAEQFCRLGAQVRQTLQPALDRILVAGADIVPELNERNFKALERKYAKNIEEMKKDYLQADPAERLEASVKRAVERSEQLYGRLGEAQRKVIAEGVAASPFDPQAWLDERLRRQRDALQTLRKLVADKPDRDTRVAALRGLVERGERSPDPGYRAYQLKLSDYNCALAARLHAATTAAQRQKARENLKGYEEDLRALLTPPAPG